MKRKFQPEKIMRILVVEDDAAACSAIAETLENEKYAVNTLNCGEYVLEEIQAIMPDLVILDLDLPDITGWDVLRIIRRDKIFFSIPVISISGRYVQPLHTVRALSEFGADGYLTKPFSKEILVSHIKAMLRRKKWNTESCMRFVGDGPVKLDSASKQMFLRGMPVSLTGAEFKILLELVKNKGVPLDRAYLMESVIGYPSPEAETRSVDKHIESLRRKLSIFSGKISTVREVGYKFLILMLLFLTGADFSRERIGEKTERQSLACAIKAKILAEGRKNKKEAEKIMRSMSLKTNEIFSRAVSDFKSGKYLSANDGFKNIMAFRPSDKRPADYMYRIYSEMSSLANREVAADAEKLAYAKGFIYYNSGEFVNAVSEWERALGINPSNSEVRFYIEKLRNYLKEMIERERFSRLKNMTQTVYDRGCYEYESGNYQRAIEKWEKVALISEKEKSSFFEEIGNLSRKRISSARSRISRKESAPQAETAVKDAAASNKYYKEGLELYSMGRISEAVIRWDLSIRYNPNNEKAVKARQNAGKEAGME